MATPLPPLAERLAAELTVEIFQVEEPYRSNLLAWLSDLAGREIVDFSDDLAAWLDELGILMMDQYTLIRIVCQEAERYFGSRRRRLS